MPVCHDARDCSQHSTSKDLQANHSGTGPVFAQRKWDCPLPEAGSCFWTSPKGRSRAAIARGILAALLFQLSAATGAFPAESGAQAPRPEDVAGQLEIKGKLIEKLVLESDTGDVRQIDQPGTSVTLPAGRYRLREVHLKGGYRCRRYPPPDEEWLALSPEEPCPLEVGAPLRPQVEVARWGRFLRMDYEVRDAGGRSYIGRDLANPPQFAVFLGDRKIGSGSFEYG